jgi:DNA-binding transcriptional regulator YdaS (Cro superfamily)
MKLKYWLDQERGRGVKLAEALHVTSVTVHLWATERVPADRCPDIERITEGMVRCEEMRPDVSWGVLREPCDCSQLEQVTI